MYSFATRDELTPNIISRRDKQYKDLYIQITAMEMGRSEVEMCECVFILSSETIML